MASAMPSEVAIGLLVGSVEIEPPAAALASLRFAGEHADALSGETVNLAMAITPIARPVRDAGGLRCEERRELLLGAPLRAVNH